MTHAELTALLTAHRIRGQKTRAALDVVLVLGLSQESAARLTNLSPSTISRALKRLSRPLCPACGQPTKQEKT